MGVTVENADHLDRVDDLRASRAKVKFLSCEPLLGSLAGVDLSGIDWVIAGGESGPQHRPVNPDWIRELREACTESGTAFFFKQWGGARAKAGGRTLAGRTWDEMPVLTTA